MRMFRLTMLKSAGLVSCIACVYIVQYLYFKPDQSTRMAYVQSQDGARDSREDTGTSLAPTSEVTKSTRDTKATTHMQYDTGNHQSHDMAFGRTTIITYTHVTDTATGITSTGVVRDDAIWTSGSHSVPTTIHPTSQRRTIAHIEPMPPVKAVAKATGTELQHIAFLKVHKAASSTLQNILYRFGLKRNLSFVVPMDNHHISKSKYLYHRIFPPLPYVMKTDDNGIVTKVDNTNRKYDILCNHAVYNKDWFGSFMHNDSVYVAIVRDPLTLFLSSAFYYRYVWPNPYLEALNESTFVQQLVRRPDLYEAQNLSQSQTFNTMAQDFGYVFTSVNEAAATTDADFQHFLDDIGRTFSLVLIVERFEESLIMLKRRLNWSFKDILYLNKNSLASAFSRTMISIPSLSPYDKRVFRKRNRFDYMIYNYFVSRFDKGVRKQIGLSDEASAFKNALRIVQEFCVDGKPESAKGTAGSPGLSSTSTNVTADMNSDIIVEGSRWNEPFNVSKEDCRLMLTNEIPFYHRIKVRHKELLYQAFKKS